jgi:hypothetical protein
MVAIKNKKYVIIDDIHPYGLNKNFFSYNININFKEVKL